jgi:hypothetical protein
VIRWSNPTLDVAAAAPLAAHAVSSEQIDAGASSAILRRLRFADGSTLVAKHVTPELDWMMRVTGDTGRAARLWIDGTMDRLPREIDPALVRIEDDGEGGFVLYMRDVRFHARSVRFDARDVERILDALAALHAAFWGERVPGLCSLADLLTLLAPAHVGRIEVRDFAEAVRAGWEAFAEVAPPDVADAVLSLVADPAPLVERLDATGTTLLHADPHFGNAVLEPDRLVLIDWTLATQGPPAVDFAWFLDHSIHLIDATHDDVAAAFLRAERGRVSREALDLGLLSELLSTGWECGQWRDDNRAERSASFDWFVAGARRALAAF